MTIVGEADSDEFAMGNAEAASDVAVYESETEATTAFEELEAGMQSESASDCLKEVLEENVKSGVEIGDVELGELSFTPPSGVDSARAYQLAISAESTSGADEGMSATVYLDFIDLREGDLIARVQTSNVLSEFDPELRDQLVDTLAGRATDSRPSTSGRCWLRRLRRPSSESPTTTAVGAACTRLQGHQRAAVPGLGLTLDRPRRPSPAARAVIPLQARQVAQPGWRILVSGHEFHKRIVLSSFARCRRLSASNRPSSTSLSRGTTGLAITSHFLPAAWRGALDHYRDVIEPRCAASLRRRPS